jgi:hypothetical protein
VRTATGSTYAVKPSAKTYGTFDHGLLDPMAARVTGAASNVNAGEMKMVHLGAGTAVEGRATQHHRITTGYTADMGHPFAARVVVDVWTAQLPVPLVNPLVDGWSPGNGPLVGLTRELAKAITSLPGTAVKVVVTTTLFPDQPHQYDAALTIMLTDVKAVDVDPAQLAIPSGFRRR